MRKLAVISIVCALLVSATGCSGQDDAAALKSAGAGQPLNQESQSAESGISQGEDAGVEASSEASLDDASTNGDSVTESNNTSDSASSLYEAFKQGSGKVKYRKTEGDRFFNASEYQEQVLTEGSSYTLDEIIGACQKVDEMLAEGTPEATFTDIDCGQDGVPELLVDIEFNESSFVSMVIKEINGELVLCYDQEHGYRTALIVNNDGTIEISGSSAANIHGEEYAFVDANGDYKFFYGCEETLQLMDDFYAYPSAVESATISVEGLDGEHIGIHMYYFESNVETRTNYYQYFMINDNYEDVTTDADYDDSNAVKQAFVNAGITPYTQTEIDKMIADKKAEIGYPD